MKDDGNLAALLCAAAFAGAGTEQSQRQYFKPVGSVFVGDCMSLVDFDAVEIQSL